MAYQYYIVDVFTDKAFSGNQLAVFPDGRGLSEKVMQSIAREFNFSETTFVFPPADPDNHFAVRIFTPTQELPFAGHPTLGTAHVLAVTGQVQLSGETTGISLEEGVGPVAVEIRASGERPNVITLSVAALPEFGPPAPPSTILADMLSIGEADLSDNVKPMAVSCGLPYLLVPVKDTSALSRCKVDLKLWEQHLSGYWATSLYVYTRQVPIEGVDIQARMFDPGYGIPEDPATGSAAAPLGGYLATIDPRDDLKTVLTVHQGVEMGRPSVLSVEVDKIGGQIVTVRVGGQSVVVSEGRLLV